MDLVVHVPGSGSPIGLGSKMRHNYSENKKVKLIVIEFSDYDIVWSNQLVLNKRRNREPVVGT